MKITLEDIEKTDGAPSPGIDAKEVLPQDQSSVEGSKFQWEKMKGKPLGEKISYLLTYYGVALIAVVAGILIIVSIARTVLSHKDYGYYAMLVNAFSVDSTAVSEDFAEYASIDTDKYNVYIDTNSTLSLNGLGQGDIGTSTVITASVQARDLDAVCFDSANFESYAVNEFFADLRNILSEEELAKYEGSLYYVDAEEIRKHRDSDSVDIASLNDVSLPSDEEIRLSLLAHQSPDKMTDPVPVGIIVKDAHVIKDLQVYPNAVPVLGFVINSTRAAENIAFLQYLYDGSVDIEKIRYVY